MEEAEETGATKLPLPLAGGDRGVGPPNFRPRLTSQAKRLRNDATPEERKLWHHLRGRRLAGFKFSRQMPIAQYVCDFLCRSARLVVEVDGGQHDARHEQDEIRTRAMEAEGYRVIRFWNNDINDRLEGVLIQIEEALRSAEAHPSIPSRKREGK